MLEGSASISLVTVYYKGLFSRDPKDLRGTVSELYLEQVLSWPALGWSGDRELIPEPRSSQTPVPACRAVLLFEVTPMHFLGFVGLSAPGKTGERQNAGRTQS